MKINDDVTLLDGMPIAHIRSLNALVIADMHLGYEGIMAKKGILLPKMNLKSIQGMLSKAIRETNASNLIVDGDIKNEFSTVDQEEFNELFEFVDFIKANRTSLTLIKGNHDNFVERYRDSLGIKVFRQATKIGKYMFFHGEELPPTESAVAMYIMGHEHPAIGLYNTGGSKEKIPCFLYGKWRKASLLVLPAINYFAGGTDVNLQPKEKLLSPIFKSINIDKMRAIAVGHGSTVDFGSVSKLRKLAYSEV